MGSPDGYGCFRGVSVGDWGDSWKRTGIFIYTPHIRYEG